MNDRNSMIRMTYRLLLDRWPSDEEVINCPYETIDELRKSILLSDEFFHKHNDIVKHLILSYLQ